jgi:hypothetical protein
MLGALRYSGGAVRAAGWGPIARSADRSGPTFALWRLDAERVAAPLRQPPHPAENCALVRV